MIRRTSVCVPGLAAAVMAIAAGCATGYENGATTTGPRASASKAEIGLAQADLGQNLYAENCASCHGDRGEGGVTKRGKVPPVAGPTALLPVRPGR